LARDGAATAVILPQDLRNASADNVRTAQMSTAKELMECGDRGVPVAQQSMCLQATHAFHLDN